MSAVKLALQLSQKNGRKRSSETKSAEVSPDSKCPICLDTFSNISRLDRCLHRFCFRCILEWSKNKAECPLCKQQTLYCYCSIEILNEYPHMWLSFFLETKMR
uniref:RING-type E3 ubiquitin transferase n=1 Tax=Neolamprologus brichardi TaxID=32507 RepID=A0A3Q4HIP0_NEOBR